MALPFTADQFVEVFVRYNVAVWPAQWLLNVLALSAIALVLWGKRGASTVVCGILAFLWLWSGAVYHLGFFARINSAAFVFAALFLTQALLLMWMGVLRSELSFERVSKPRFVTGAFLMSTALLIYPALSFLFGHRYPATPTFGLPCPTTVFTFGLLMWSKPPTPKRVLIVPSVWSVIGLTATVALGMYEDSLLFLGFLSGALTISAQRKSNLGYLAHAGHFRGH